MVERYRWLIQHFGRWLAVASVIVGLIALGGAQWRMQQIVDKVEREAALRIATNCVAAWERVEQIRDGDEKTYRSNAETLIGLSTTADPARIQQYRELVEGDVLQIRAANADPECDLKEAQKTLAK